MSRKVENSAQERVRLRQRILKVGGGKKEMWAFGRGSLQVVPRNATGVNLSLGLVGAI